jgi:hypothetical protein
MVQRFGSDFGIQVVLEFSCTVPLVVPDQIWACRITAFVMYPVRVARSDGFLFLPGSAKCHTLCNSVWTIIISIIFI